MLGLGQLEKPQMMQLEDLEKGGEVQVCLKLGVVFVEEMTWELWVCFKFEEA